MTPIIYAILGGIVLGWVLCKISNGKDVPVSEDHISQESLNWVLRQERNQGRN